MEWGVGGGGGEGAVGRIGSLFIFFKQLGNASQVWVVGVVRARGVWARIGSPHLGNASQVCSGEETQARAGVGAGGCGHALAAFKYSLNTQKMQPGVGSGEAGVVWCGR